MKSNLIADEIQRALNMIQTGKHVQGKEKLEQLVWGIKTGVDEMPNTGESKTLSDRYNEGYFGDELRSYFNADRQIKELHKKLWERILRMCNKFTQRGEEHRLNFEWMEIVDPDDYVTNIKNVLKVLATLKLDKELLGNSYFAIKCATDDTFKDVADTDRKCIELANHSEYGVTA